MKLPTLTHLAAHINDHYLSTLIQPNTQEIIVIGIDGPTAAGKTMLADTLADQIHKAFGRPCWIFRLDWTLVSRETRLQDAAHLKKSNVYFKLEAELHMRLELASNFLKEISLFNQKLKYESKLDSKSISINQLYSRENHGKTTGQTQCQLQPGLVVLIEGHYTLAPLLDEHIDFNILLLGKPEIFLKRKIARVQAYRDSQATEDYFWRIDMPSFQHHLSRFYQNADLIIDNSDYQTPTLASKDCQQDWLSTREKINVHPSLDHDALMDTLFSSSQLSSKSLNLAIQSAIETLIEWDQYVGQYLRLSLSDIDTDLLTVAKQLVDRLNQQKGLQSQSFAIKHTNALHNVYYRKLPITLGICMSGPIEINLITDVLHDVQRIQIIWAGGYHRFQRHRTLGAIDPEKERMFEDITPRDSIHSDPSKPIDLITPTSFTVPSFLEKIAYNPVFSGHEDENISASETLCRLSKNGGIWIHRFAKFSELNYFIGILKVIGAKALKIGNYLIAVLTNHPEINAAFHQFSQEWEKPLLYQNEIADDENKLDAIIDKERKELHHYVQKHCSDFLVLDGYLQCPKLSREISVWSRIVVQIELMLKSPSRLVRKRITQFIELFLPELSLSVSKLWDDAPADATSRISLDAYTSLSPSILAELYLWLAIKNDQSAILGANIYDIRKTSADCHAYIEAASERNTAIVLQGSLNALGQKEMSGNQVYQGYLKPKNAAQDLVQAALTAARDLLLTEGKEAPLFSIGLDHVDATNDHPPGRARRFMKSALDSENVTHYVLDGSALFHVNDDSNESLTSAYHNVTRFAINLLDNNESSYIVDKEICVGELNYVGQQTEAMIPTTDNIALFASIYQQQIRHAGLGALNTRPTLFIGNLGTTHHNFDMGTTAVHMAKPWRDHLKRYGFISPVLHGTTNSHPSVLQDATVGCHKINVAGDLLHTLINSLPTKLRDRVLNDENEPKKSIHLIREAMDSMSYAEAHHQNQSLKAHCRTLLDTINSPSLEPMDIQYFRYKNYQFSTDHIQVIVDELKEYAIQHSINKKSTTSYDQMNYEFSASLIEVPFDEQYKEIVTTLWEEGIRYFHIDAGDGKFVPREFSGLEKTKYIKQQFPEAILHAHLMVENPHLSTLNLSRKSIIEEYISNGCEAIAVHMRAFSHKDGPKQALQLIQKLGARAGLLIETSDPVDESLWSFIKENKVDWAIVMGVPVGYGGQIFDISSLKRISALHQFSIRDNYPFLIEVDGGLTKEIIPLCRQAGAQVFSGWSIIKARKTSGLQNNVQQIQAIIA